MRTLALAWILGGGLGLCACPAARAAAPGTKHAATPGGLGLQAEDVTFPAADSATVRGWWFPGAESAPAVVVAPRGSGTMADLLPAVQQFLARGFAVLTFDYRGFGPGTTPEAADSLRYIVFNSQWVDDMLGALRYARARGSRRVFAWGQDLGSAVAFSGAARDRRSCDALAVEGLFRSSQDVLFANGTSILHEVVVRHRRLVQGRDEPFSAAARLTVPLLVVLAGKDEVTPAATTKLVAGRALTFKRFQELPEAAHAGAEGTPGYFDMVTEWFQRWMAPSRTGRR
jgi:alpha-beta hydrolase superfamily lysophospholipase